MGHFSTVGVYGTNVTTGTVLGFGSGGNQFVSNITPAEENGARGPDDRYTEPSYQSGGTVNYLRPDFITTQSAVSLNNISGNDVNITENGPLHLEQHTSKYGRKLAITSIDNHGNITYGATNGATYGFATTSGTPTDRPIDAAKNPYGTPPNFVFLEGAGPVAHAFNSLSSL